MISRKLHGRTDNEIKNFWNTHIKKKLIRAGCDPTTHQPRTDLMSCLRSILAIANFKNMILRQNHNFQDYCNVPYLQHIGHQLPTQMVNPDFSFPAALRKQNPNLNSLQQQMEDQNESTLFQPLHHPMTINHSPHVPFAYNTSQIQSTTTSFDDGSSFIQSLEFDQKHGFWNTMPSSFPSTSETTSIGNAGEVTSTSSYNNGSDEQAAAAYSQWEELLIAPVMQ